MQETLVRFLGWKDLLENRDLPTPVFLGFLCGSAGKRIHLQCGRPGFNPWVGKIPWRRKRLLKQYSSLQNSIDCIVHGDAKSWTWLNNIHFTSGRWRNEKSRKQTQRLCMVSYYLYSGGSVWPSYFCFRIFIKHKEIEKKTKLACNPIIQRNCC